MSSYENAQRLRMSAHLREARTELLTCGGPACPQALRKDCLHWLEEVDRSLPSVVLAVRSGSEDLVDVRVSVDGALLATHLDGAAITVDPGTRLFRFEAPGYEAQERKVVIREGEKSRVLTVELRSTSAAPRSKKSKAPAITLAAVAVVGLGCFTYFGLKGMSGKSDLEPCKGHCPQGDVDNVSRDFLVADISLGVGVLALGAASYFFFSDRSSSTSAAQRPVWIDLSSGRGVAGATLGGHF
ncbi:MAG: hypothetical protein HY898_21050 [Deltaproteobacteria bacterium]|nr:hypothetical protein [Deltaproteobacteria bacterium]